MTDIFICIRIENQKNHCQVHRHCRQWGNGSHKAGRGSHQYQKQRLAQKMFDRGSCQIPDH